MDKIDSILTGGNNGKLSGRAGLAQEIKTKIVPRAKKLGVEWVTARQVMDVLNELGHNRKGANAVGDAMGKHSDGLNLPTKKIGNKTNYKISTLY